MWIVYGQIWWFTLYFNLLSARATLCFVETRMRDWVGLQKFLEAIKFLLEDVVLVNESSCGTAICPVYMSFFHCHREGASIISFS